MRRTFVLLAWPAFLSVAFAQAPPDPDPLARAQQAQAAELVTQWLHDPQPQRQAWAAYFVMRGRRRDLIPALLEDVVRYQDLEPPSSQAQQDAEFAMQAKLDALIQLDAEVPSPEAARLYVRFPLQAMILLACSSNSASQELFTIWDHAKSNEMWLAAGNLLLELRPRGFASRLLSSLTLQAAVEVSDPGTRRPIAGRTSGDNYRVTHPQHDGWPEVGSYTPVVFAQRGSVLFAAGRTPVSYARRIDRSYVVWKETYDGSPYRNQLRHAYLMALVEKMPLPFEPKAEITWAGPEACQRSDDQFTAEIQAQYSALVAELQLRRLLTDGERQEAKLHVIWQIRDFRTASHDPLPRTVASETEAWFPSGNGPAL